MRGRLGDVAGDEYGGHGGAETDLPEGVALPEFGAGRHGGLETGPSSRSAGPVAVDALRSGERSRVRAGGARRQDAAPDLGFLAAALQGKGSRTACGH
ncbi:hypothetical protein VT52_013340 [Streptomyces malaysiense]|uniref:Uncharacterized protein n=1 Tax=Streptomyces malaysiense TaxID=1428626 RepID=A0A1J4Q4S7_9ACTN|nr:hypothetical protein VT52_013340 [Streptomyces malaysiense]